MYFEDEEEDKFTCQLCAKRFRLNPARLYFNVPSYCYFCSEEIERNKEKTKDIKELSEEDIRTASHVPEIDTEEILDFSLELNKITRSKNKRLIIIPPEINKEKTNV